MKKIYALLISASLLAVVAFADPINITIYDESGYLGLGVGGEDQETEPGMQNYQKWDLEGFFMEDNMLSMVGGFNFVTGVEGYSQYPSGDIFIDIDGDAGVSNWIPTQGNHTVVDNFGYEYVVDLNFDDLSYNIYDITSSTTTTSVWYTQNALSNPWKYVSGGAYIGTGIIQYEGGLTDADVGFAGGWHNSATVDLSFLDGTEFTSHFTMGCGNDNLMGHRTISVPEPGTLSLLSMGSLCLIGFWALRRKKEDD